MEVVFEFVELAVKVFVGAGDTVLAILRERVGEEDLVLERAALTVPHEEPVDVLEELGEAVYVAVAELVLEAEADFVELEEKVLAAEGDDDAVLLMVRNGARESVMEVEVVAEARRVILTGEVPVGVWLLREVTDGVAEMVDVRVRGGERLGDGETSTGDALLALQRVGVGDAEFVLEALVDALADLVRRMLGLVEADAVGVLEVAGVRVRVPEAVCVRVGRGLRVGDELTVDVLEVDTLLVDVGVLRMVRDWGAERVKEGLLDDVLDGRKDAVNVGLLDAVLETGLLRVRVGLAERVLETAGEAVPVLEVVAVLVAVAVDVVVRVEVWDAVEAGEAVDVLEIAPDFVCRRVGCTDLVEVVLGVWRRDAGAESVGLVVFVEVLDCVLVAVGRARRCRSSKAAILLFQGDVETVPMRDKSKSQRILLLLSGADT